MKYQYIKCWSSWDDGIKRGLGIKSLLDTMLKESMYLPPLSTIMYCVPSSDIENPLSVPFSLSVGRY